MGKGSSTEVKAAVEVTQTTTSSREVLTVAKRKNTPSKSSLEAETTPKAKRPKGKKSLFKEGELAPVPEDKSEERFEDKEAEKGKRKNKKEKKE